MSLMNVDDMELNAGADKLAPASAAVCSMYDATCRASNHQQQQRMTTQKYRPPGL